MELSGLSVTTTGILFVLSFGMSFTVKVAHSPIVGAVLLGVKRLMPLLVANQIFPPASPVIALIELSTKGLLDAVKTTHAGPAGAEGGKSLLHPIPDTERQNDTMMIDLFTGADGAGVRFRPFPFIYSLGAVAIVNLQSFLMRVKGRGIKIGVLKKAGESVS